MLLAESCESLLLGYRVDVRTNHEADQVEERNPQVLGDKLLRKGEADGRNDPRDAHHLPEAYANGGANLMVRPGACDKSHRDEVHHILDWGNLSRVSD